ncbi:uncharacterized protein N7484_004361 [Penicillium longicatenatum]|uniref:uncharacterized protein n=1 Tax=Penicillium longicatenatum TaxID=1561947 RepID=UPI00254954FD|nr:uncharacterized protein N7484_004361 [Penicillium longicatenatum]KAJ5650638.1 hypothetical protein N7484_004361 [Penicillium longicatenatum]
MSDLLKGYVDIALTYEREQEEIAVSEGWAENAGCIFHDHFTLVGPEHDPASVSQAKCIEEAFDRVASKTMDQQLCAKNEKSGADAIVVHGRKV